ncbi:24-methylenesterol C-methyltransferase 2 [Selaginella moellendorffii]|nr:24-methylenesterol C-methyltransferase 2 [Selaginella moellendorffii]|eukprot:XP_002978719.2 24-methylenesterol C-methyltransferase 2 [Selaginella moellendorffii]
MESPTDAGWMVTWGLLGTGAAMAAAGLYWAMCVAGSAEQKGKRAVDLGGGSLSRGEVAGNYREYAAFFDKPQQIAAKDKVPKLVDTFYNLVTDIYEWGWGQSFHFSPAVPGVGHREETKLHEKYVADLLELGPGQRVLDAGCGVGGPMRTIAAHSGSNVVGITINDYQVARARSHNSKAGLSKLCEVICGDFLHMPFGDDSFDAAYSIEATCHAPQLRDVYAEIYRVLKPGKLYVSYEWVTTCKYQAQDPEHVKIIHEIEHGNALPGLRSYKQVVEIAKEVGFEVLEDRDLALPPAHPWWTRLKMGRLAYYRNHVVIALLSFLGIAPQGVFEVHEMLFKTAMYLTRGGETGIFSPMHLLVCRKPLDGGDAATAATAAVASS